MRFTTCGVHTPHLAALDALRRGWFQVFRQKLGKL